MTTIVPTVHRIEIAMLADKLIEQANQLAEAYATAETCRAMARLTGNDTERANLNARADFWDATVCDQHAKLTAALNTALPPTIYTVPDVTAPVRMITGSEIEVRGHLDHGARAVSIRFTGAQAVTIGAAMIACAGAQVEHAGARLAEILPSIPRT